MFKIIIQIIIGISLATNLLGASVYIKVPTISKSKKVKVQMKTKIEQKTDGKGNSKQTKTYTKKTTTRTRIIKKIPIRSKKKGDGVVRLGIISVLGNYKDREKVVYLEDSINYNIQEQKKEDLYSFTTKKVDGLSDAPYNFGIFSLSYNGVNTSPINQISPVVQSIENFTIENTHLMFRYIYNIPNINLYSYESKKVFERSGRAVINAELFKTNSTHDTDLYFSGSNDKAYELNFKTSYDLDSLGVLDLSLNGYKEDGYLKNTVDTNIRDNNNASENYDNQSNYNLILKHTYELNSLSTIYLGLMFNERKSGFIRGNKVFVTEFETGVDSNKTVDEVLQGFSQDSNTFKDSRTYGINLYINNYLKDSIFNLKGQLMTSKILEQTDLDNSATIQTDLKYSGLFNFEDYDLTQFSIEASFESYSLPQIKNWRLSAGLAIYQYDYKDFGYNISANTSSFLYTDSGTLFLNHKGKEIRYALDLTGDMLLPISVKEESYSGFKFGGTIIADITQTKIKKEFYTNACGVDDPCVNSSNAPEADLIYTINTIYNLANYGAEITRGKGDFYAKRTDLIFLPRLGYIYTFLPIDQKIDELNSYITFRRSYIPGGFNRYSFTDTGGAMVDEKDIAEKDKYEPQYNNEISTGIDITLPKLVFNTKVNYVYMQDVHYIDSVLPLSLYYGNVDKAYSTSIDFRAQWRMLPQANFLAHITATNARYDRFFHYPTIIKDPLYAKNYSNNYIPYIPLYKARLRFDYFFRNGFYTSIEGVTNGKTYLNNSNTIFSRKYNLLNLTGGYEVGNFTVLLFINNVFDERYIESGYYEPYNSAGESLALLSNQFTWTATANRTIGRPKTFGIQLSYSF